MKERADELHQKLLEYQKRLIGELKPISTKIDLSGAKEQAIKKVKGLSLSDSLLQLALMLNPQQVDGLKRTVEEHAKEFPFTYLMGGVKINEKGKTIGRKPGLISDTKEDYEAALLAHMFSEALFGFHVVAAALIEPITRQINLEHAYNDESFLEPVSNNPFIPEGREYLYALGLSAGLSGDFPVAISLLVPQLENSVRYLLDQIGVRSSGLNSEGIQQEFDLNTTLRMPEVEKIFGRNMIFTLRALLVEREGANIRNRMAHGLLSHAEFYSTDCLYLWGIILRLCCWPALLSKQDHKGEKPSAASDLTPKQ